MQVHKAELHYRMGVAIAIFVTIKRQTATSMDSLK